MLKGAYAEKVLKGIKKATIRRGIVKPKYEEVIVHAGGKPIAKIKITRMYFKKVKDLGDYEAKLEGYSTKDELINELKKVYKDIHDDEYMTIIEFEVIQ
ncbi:MAG: ASCH domain-containing protein, partial [Desulfurococcaceae archaeon]